MPRRKPVEAAESVPAIAEPKKKTVRKAAETPKSVASKSAHKHHAKTSAEPVVETPVAEAVPAAPIANATAAVPSRTIARTVTQEEIAIRAYSYWESRGFQGGSPQEDWLRAERELLELA